MFGFGNMSMGIDAYGSCTPAGIIRLLEYYKIDVQGLMLLLLEGVQFLENLWP